MLFEIDGLVGLVLLALWVYCIYDVITTDEVLIRHLPKTAWLMIVLFLPDLGSIIWLIAGRPEKAAFRPGGATSSFWKSTGPEDKPGWGGRPDPDSFSPIVREREERSELRMREEQLRRREEELRRREEALRRNDPPPDPGPEPDLG